MELAEGPEEAVIRETKEETTLEVENPVLVDVVSNVDLDDAGNVKYHYIIIEYYVQVKAGTAVASSDAAELRWVRLAEVENFDLTVSFRLFFRRNRHKLEKIG